jgi:glutaredoxin
MEFIEPEKKGFTIYSKSGCLNCLITKKLLKEKNFFFTEVNCDDYILEEKDEFLKFIENISENNYKTFPIIFYDGKFIGGLNQTKEFINKLLISFEENF